MMNNILFALGVFGVLVSACTNPGSQELQTRSTENPPIKTANDMKSFVSIFEIPATKVSRAVDFYQAILDLKIEKMDMPGMLMGVFPYEDQMVMGVILEAEGFKPSADGVTIYLNGGDDLQVVLDKVEENGGKIIVPKTLHADESGYFAIFLDSEGNRLGLHSPH